MRTIINNSLFCLLAMVAATLCGCSDSIFDDEAQNDGGSIRLAADIEQLSVMRVNDSGFCDGDMMGVYVVDYEGGNPGTLKLKGNRGDNVRYTFDEAANKWTGAYELYWKDGHTPVDVYGYYPFAAPESIEDYQFEVQKDQSKASSSDEMGGYEASDFLWGKVDEVAPTSSVIRLPLSHRMSNARVTLLQGTGFTAEEWAATEKIVLVQNVARKASINLANGTVRKAGEVEPTATLPSCVGNEWRAIVVPQTVPQGAALFSITIGGTPFKFTRPNDFEYKAGHMMNFSIRVDKQQESGQYKLTLVSASVSEWESDLVSHNATAKEYVVVNATPGKLKEAKVTATRMAAFSLLISFGMIIILGLLGPVFPHFYNTTDEIRELATKFIWAVAAATPFISLSNSEYFILRSGGKTIITFLFDSCFVCLVNVPVAICLTKFTAIHIVGIFFLVNMLEGIKALIGFIMVKKDIWLNTIVD